MHGRNMGSHGRGARKKQKVQGIEEELE